MLLVNILYLISHFVFLLFYFIVKYITVKQFIVKCEYNIILINKIIEKLKIGFARIILLINYIKKSKMSLKYAIYIN